ncbi:MAG: hypothetical protein AB7I98_12510 [Verrucomicrobiales bacterium]|nr:hypothetical protein [Verrucomicrobiae bacterium]MCP5553787.1 hypothetical protein [Akkermansiaceae bacterium]
MDSTPAFPLHHGTWYSLSGVGEQGQTIERAIRINNSQPYRGSQVGSAFVMEYVQGNEGEGFSEGRSKARLVKLRGDSYALMLISPMLGENLWVIHPLTHRGLLLCFPRGAANFCFEAGDDPQDWLNALASDRKHEKMPMHGWAGLFEPVGWAAMLEAWQGDLSLLLSLW